MIVCAVVCPAPPLLARELTGADPVVADLREACASAVADLVAAGPGLIAVTGVAAVAADWDPAGHLDLGLYAPGRRGGLAPGAGRSTARAGPALPLSLGLGARLLDEAGYRGPRRLQSVSEDTEPGECAVLGKRLAAAAERVGILVMADGSARRSLKAPGYLDERSAPFDESVQQALRDGDLAALLDLDAGLARDLMATGRPAWQVLAGSMNGQRPAGDIRYTGDPFGVAYLVAVLRP